MSNYYFIQFLNSDRKCKTTLILKQIILAKATLILKRKKYLTCSNFLDK